jgi:hypothetical protein
MARLLTVIGGLAFVAVLFAGCGGGGDDRATVEANLRHYISTLGPEGSALPVGAGPPRVRDNACQDRHVKTKRGQEVVSRTAGRIFPTPVALWSCVVRFRSLAVPVLVAVNESNEVVWLAPGRFEQFEVK